MSEWRTARLHELLEGGKVSYGVVQPGQTSDEGVPIIRVGDLRNGRVRTSSPVRVSAEIAERHERTRLRGGELLFSLVGTVGETAIAPQSLAGWNVARAIAVLRPVNIDARWLYFSLQAPYVKSQVLASLNTTVQATLNLADLRQIKLRVPSISAQRAAADVLSALDEKILANRHCGEVIERLQVATFLSAKQASDWKAPLNEFASILLGGTPSRDRSDYWHGGGVPWITSGKANEQLITEPSEYITSDALSNSAAKLIPQFSTVIAITGATLGQVARLGIEAAGNQSLVGIVASDRATSEWLHLCVRSEIPQLLESATGAAQQHVSKADVAALLVPAPPLDLDVISAQWIAQTDKLLLLATETKRLTALRETLLPALMSGKLRVKDAERAVEEVL